MTQQPVGSSQDGTPVSTELSIWGVTWATVRQSPWWGKLAMVGFGTAFVAATVLGVVGLASRDHPRATWHVVSIVLANIGLLLLCVTALVHTGTQQAWRRPEILRTFARLPFHARASKLHAVMLALPIIAFSAGICLAAGIALLVPSMVLDPWSDFFIIAGSFYGLFIVVAGWTVADTTRFLFRQVKEHADEAALARHEATTAQLAALQTQLNPHFLFNALNTVASLVRSSPRSAETTVENLAHVLRRTLARSRRTLCTVREELDYLQAYLSVERERFGNRLQVTLDVDPQAHEIQVPTMTLQPLVENALKHAVATRINGGVVRIAVHVADGNLQLSVEDDGSGFAPGYVEGTGLSNLRERLATMYGEDATLRVCNIASGARVVLRLPAARMTNGNQGE